MNRTGDGHKMGVWAGGEIELTTHTKMIHDARVGRVDTPHLPVNAKGERFMCEGPMQGYLNNYVREYIHEAGGDAKAASAASVALEARRRIDAMFKVDSKFDDMEPGGRKAARDAELRPLMEDFGGWARAQLPLASPKLAPHRALQYAVEFWPYVMNVLEDGAPGALEQRRRAGPANLRRRAQELALQRCAARRAGVCGDIQRHHHGQGQRAQSQALRRVAADRDAQRRRAHR